MTPSERPPEAAPATRGDIQGLRAVAVLLVVLSHASVPGFSGGYVGVDVFFVISGFLITGILLRELGRSGRVSLLDFYARRARRILPAASVVLLAVTGVSWLSFGYIRLSEVLDDVVWATLFGANIHESLSGSDYFAADSFLSPVQHFWSLAVEEQFYVVWPALIALVALGGRRDVRRHVTVVLLVLCAVSLAWSVHQTAAMPTSAYFSTLTRGWELGAGALLALAAPHLKQLTRGFLGLCSWVGVALIAYACVMFTEATAFPGSAALVPVLGSVLVLAGGIRPTPRGASLVLDRAPMRWVGDISYSLYLWHWPLLVIPAGAVGHSLGLGLDLLLVVAAVLLSALTFRYVETPFRDRRFWRHGRVRSLSLWPGAVVVVLAAVSVVGVQASGTAGPARLDLDPQQAGGRVDPVRAVEHAASRAAEKAPLPDGLTPSPLELGEDNWTLPRECWSSTEDVRHDVCTLGDESADRTLVLLGDSHIGMWTDPIVQTAEKRGWKVVLFLKTGCPPIDAPMWRNERSGDYPECESYRAWSQERIAELEPDRIVMTGYTYAPLVDPETGSKQEDEAEVSAAYAEGMDETLTRLTEITPAVTVIGDTNQLSKAPVDCLGERDATLGTCAEDVSSVTDERNTQWRAAAKEHDARFVDVEPWLCADEVCPLVVGNVVVYTDRHHLTRTYTATLQPVLARALRL